MLLSKTLNPDDYQHLERELRTVDAYALALKEQHPQRRWEYALALHAIGEWLASGRRIVGPVYDVGGAGSPFYYMLRDWTQSHDSVIVIDPALVNGYTLAEYLGDGEARLAPVVTCISVIEHIKELERFCYHLSCLVAPGGLLFLTMDYWNRCGPDTAKNNVLRERIFCPKELTALRKTFHTYQLHAFGGMDPTYYGPRVEDYTFHSLALEKQR